MRHRNQRAICDYTVRLSDFEKHPIAALQAAHGEVLAVMYEYLPSPAFYAVPSDLFETMVQQMTEAGLLRMDQ